MAVEGKEEARAGSRCSMRRLGWRLVNIYSPPLHPLRAARFFPTNRWFKIAVESLPQCTVLVPSEALRGSLCNRTHQYRSRAKNMQQSQPPMHAFSNSSVREFLAAHCIRLSGPSLFCIFSIDVDVFPIYAGKFLSC